MKQVSNPSNTANHEKPVSDTQPRIGKWTEIGDVKIIQTRFGKVKVQVVTTQNDHLRNWIFALILLLALGVASWQAWQSWQQPEDSVNAESTNPETSNGTEKQPLSQAGMNTRAPVRSQADSRPEIAVSPATAAVVANPKVIAQQVQSLGVPEQGPANPAKQTSPGQPAIQPATAPPSVKVMPDIAPVAVPAVVPEKPISTSPAPAGNIQQHVSAEAKP